MGKFDGDLILSDLDGTLFSSSTIAGTLISSGGVISDENADALEYFMKNGGKFGFGTGRYNDFIYNLRVKPNCPCIVFNGAMIVDGDRIIFENPFKTDIYQDIVKKALDDMPFISELRTSVNSLVNSSPVYKYVFITSTESDGDKVSTYLKSRYSESCEVIRSWPLGNEILEKGSTKGNCALKIKQYTGAKRLCCIGDYENDISMLKSADIAFAPQNAIEPVKQAADIITPDCDHNALEYIVKYLEKQHF